MELIKTLYKDYVLTWWFCFENKDGLIFCLVFTDQYWKQKKVYFDSEEMVNNWILQAYDSDQKLKEEFKNFLITNNFKKVSLQIVEKYEFLKNDTV